LKQTSISVRSKDSCSYTMKSMTSF